MEDFLRWLAAWRGIKPDPGSELQFEFANFPSGGLGMLVLLGCALTIVMVALLYRRDGKNLQTWQRVVLASLRCVALLAVIALLLEPNLVTVQREVRPGHTILLVDKSQSMTHLDAWRRDNVQATAQSWRAIGVAEPAGASRIDLVKALLAHGDGELVKKLAAKNQVQLYSFAGNLDELPIVPAAPRIGPDGKPLPPEPLPPEPLPPEPLDPTAPPPVPQLDLGKLVADGRATNLGGSLRTALDRSRAAEIAAVVFVSDGRRTAGPQAAEVARLLNQRKIPHTFVLGVGDPSETQTISLTRLQAPAKVFQGEPWEIKANIASQGYDPISVTARLVRIDDKGAEQVVRTQQVQVGGEHADALIEWKDLSDDAPGRYLFRTEIQPPDGEPVVAERHSKVTAVEVLGQRLRLLLLAGGASHEFQILRNLLIRDKTIDVSCWLQSADPKFPQDGDEAVRIDKLPEERVDFDPYDVVVMMDPDGEKLSATFCKNLADHITEDGCGLWWVVGEKHTLDSMRKTSNLFPVSELLPIIPDIEFADVNVIGLGKVFVVPRPFALTPEGEEGLGAKVARIADGKDDSRILWSRLPGAHFWFPITRLKAAAVPLVEHASPDLRRNGRGMPLLVLQSIGAGRVLFSGTDETYRWRSVYESAYDRFWVNGIRFLFEGRVQAGNSRLRLLANADKIDLGDAIEIQAEVKDERLQPQIQESFPIVVDRETEGSETLQLLPVEAAPGSYSLRFRPTQLGSYRVHPSTPIGKNTELEFQVVSAQIEREGPMDRTELLAVASAVGGEYFDDPQALLAALDRIPSRSATDTFRTPHAIWDGWPTITFILVVLGLEWLLRKRFNLL